MYEKLSKIIGFVKARLWVLLWKGGFKSFGAGSVIGAPLRIDGMKNISIGSGVYIREKAWLYTDTLLSENPSLSIGDGTYIGHLFHAVALGNVTIERKVIMADKVFITDNFHGYKDVGTPIIDQPLELKGDVTIGEGAWLGENVCVIGANVGKYSIVGANAVVTKDIPDYCIAGGVPAKVLKKYDHAKKEWVSAR
ncbi:hypothetical protein R9C00_20245 [Flammeovirgaceae bacterium SG7u.111]|nr:hypothetical protein [Flammeovirgaceae bacterium SG7u.132]WPO34033.1 hypothetical protein R9C00_20245 [Flammeovirgaceae bacterium SG7u.111]